MLQEVAESELCPFRRWSHAVRIICYEKHLVLVVDRLDVGLTLASAARIHHSDKV